MMTCGGCGKESHQIRGIVDEGIYSECCTNCAGLSSYDVAQHDVYWPGKPYYSDAMDVKFESKEHKVRVMKERGLVEVGDTVNGSRRLEKKGWHEATLEHRKRQFRQKDMPKLREIYGQYIRNVRAKQ